MRLLAILTMTAFAAPAVADDKGTAVEIAGLKSTTPGDWKEETPSSSMRLAQFKVPKADGDKEDAEVQVFFFKGGGSGSAADNLKRQVAKFQPNPGKDKVEEAVDKEFKVGALKAVYQDVKGTFIKKPNPMAEKGTPFPNYRQLYVIFENDAGQSYVLLVGPEKTVEKAKKGFDEWVKNFK